MQDTSFILLVLFNAAIAALFLVVCSKVTKKEPKCHFLSAIAYPHLLAGAALGFVWLISAENHRFDAIDAAFWPYLLLAAGINMTSIAMYFYAYSKIDVANVTIFSACTPIYAAFTSWWFLGEIISWPSMFGIAVVVAGVYYFHTIGIAGPDNRFLAPFARMASSRPTRLAFLATIPPAFSIVAGKKAIIATNPVLYCACVFSLIGVFALAVERTALRNVRGTVSLFSVFPPKFMVAAGVLLSLVGVSGSTLITRGNVGEIMSLQRMSIIFQMIFAYFLLKEGVHIKKKLAAAVVIVAGATLIGR